MEWKHFWLWLPMIVIAFANASLREYYLVKRFSELRAHQLSTVTLIFFCSLYTAFIFPFLSIRSTTQALIIGLLWVILTVVFEFSLGRAVKRPWTYLLQDYNLFAGRIWLLFLIILLLLPYLFYSIR